MGCASPSTNGVAVEFHPYRLERVFDACFAGPYRTLLRGGAAEPFYRPAEEPAGYHILHYRDDYFASALHEAAHWCIAGKERRLQADFGYWYVAGDRDVAQQRAFEIAESRPQALEWIFSAACNYSFRPSADNLALGRKGVLDGQGFGQRVLAEARAWQERGLGNRALAFYQALCAEFCTSQAPEELKLDAPG